MKKIEKWSFENIPSLNDKIMIVTGGNSGLGYESVKAFSQKGAKVILACRNTEKGNAAREEIYKSIGKRDIEVMKLDLANLVSVNEFAMEFSAKYHKLEVLLNNAGIMSTPYGLTKDGFEQQMGVNHMGHFALTGFLFDILKNSPGARVVNVSSNAHKKGEMDFDNLLFTNGVDYDPWRAYRRSKLANLLFTYELQRRAQMHKLNLSAMAAHPGGSETNLARHLSGKLMFKIFMPLAKLIIQSAAQGALPQLRAATDPNAQGGDFYGPDGWKEIKGYPVKVESAAQAYNEADAKRLWETSEKLTGVQISF